MEVKIENKNLFDDEIEYGSISPNGQPLPTQNCIRSKNFIEVKPETNYNLQNNSGYKGFIYLYDKDKNYLNYFTITSCSFNFITISSTKYIKFRSLSNENSLSTKYQLELGSATSYVPHQEQNLPFTLEEGQFLADGESLSDDGINKNEIQLILNGTENWIKRTNTNNTFQFSPEFITKTGLCTHYTKFKNGSEMDTKEGIYLSNTASIIITDLRFTTVEEFKQWLAEEFINNPVMLQLVTSTSSKTIQYTATQQTQYNAIKKATSYDDITYITSESDELGFDMNVVAVADANKLIDNQNSEIDTIKSRLDLLEG